MKIPCSTPVTVTVTVKDTWCKESHPQDFVDDIGGDGPINGLFELGEKPGAHISPPVVYTHGASAAPVWGQYADQGVANIATTGNSELFLQNHGDGLSYWSPVSAVDMCEDGYWVATKTISAVPYDAGVDSGAFF